LKEISEANEGGYFTGKKNSRSRLSGIAITGHHTTCVASLLAMAA
jgi:hypothetical protein